MPLLPAKGDPEGGEINIRVSMVMLFQSRQQNSDTETIWPSLYRDPERPADHVASEWQAQSYSPGFLTSCKICLLQAVLFPTHRSPPAEGATSFLKQFSFGEKNTIGKAMFLFMPLYQL